MKKIFLLLLFLNITAQGQLILDQKVLEQTIDTLVSSKIGSTTPGLVVGVIHKDKLIFSKGYGLANLAYDIPNSPKMLYNIGSITKQFIGYAFAMLHVQGKLNINDPVTKHLKDFPKFDKIVTLKHLLTHTSGYREAYAISNLAGRTIGIDRLTRKECIDVVKRQTKLEFEPGSRYSYNSTAWVILTEVLENVTRNLADNWVENNIFKPLKMNDTQIETYIGKVIKNGAESYTYNDDEKGYANTKGNRAIFGAADIYSSLEDLTKWVKNYHTSELGGKAVKDLFLKPHILNNGINSGYALGIGVKNFHGLKRYRHIGRHESFETDISYFPKQDLGIITISNFGNSGRLSTSKLARVLLKNYLKNPKPKSAVKVSRKNLKKIEGLYLASTNNKTLSIEFNKSLYINGVLELIPTSKNTFRLNRWDSFKIKSKDTLNRIQLIVENDTKDTYTKVPKWKPKKSKLIDFQGEYWSDEVGTYYNIYLENEKLVIRHRWIKDIYLEPITKGVFATSEGFFVKFTRGNNNQINGFNINTSRTLNVFFKKK